MGRYVSEKRCSNTPAMLRGTIRLLYILFVLPLFCACVSSQKVAYFSNLKDSELPPQVKEFEQIIQKNDLLYISVSSLNPEASRVFNAANFSGIQNPRLESSDNRQLYGYLVNEDGLIQFPMLGVVKAAGVTKKQLQEAITRDLISRKLLLDPIVDIRFLNFKVTVLGEVGKPTVITVPNEKITLLEAIGLAGDLTIFGKRDNVLLIRESEGKKEVKRLDLNSSDLLSSPYYYLQNNDVVYVEPNKAKMASATQSKMWLPVIFSGLSMVAIVVDRLIR